MPQLMLNNRKEDRIMKNYIKPSVEMSTFDVESIMDLSGGTVNAAATDVNAVTNEVYREYLEQQGIAAAADNGYVEFWW